MGTWGTPIIPPEALEYYEELKRKEIERRERQRRENMREDARRTQDNDDVNTVMGLYALNSYATHMAGSAAACETDSSSSDSSSSSSDSSSSSGGGMD
jgi:hypothetical protein